MATTAPVIMPSLFKGNPVVQAYRGQGDMGQEAAVYDLFGEMVNMSIDEVVRGIVCGWVDVRRQRMVALQGRQMSGGEMETYIEASESLRFFRSAGFERLCEDTGLSADAVFAEAARRARLPQRRWGFKRAGREAKELHEAADRLTLSQLSASGPIRCQALAEVMGVSRHVMQSRLTKLRRLGWAEKLPVGPNAVSWQARATPRGHGVKDLTEEMAVELVA